MVRCQLVGQLATEGLGFQLSKVGSGVTAGMMLPHTYIHTHARTHARTQSESVDSVSAE